MTNAAKNEAKQWGSFEQWKEDLFPERPSRDRDECLDFKTLVEKAAEQSLAQAARDLHAP